MSTQLTGRTFVADFGSFRSRLTYESDTRLKLTVLEGGGLVADGHTETVDVEIAELRPQVYVISWREASGATVVRVEDQLSSTVHAVVTMDGQLTRMVGTLTME